ncbi:MAG TPA: hypothetical protein VFE03_07260 [Caulobacteraceae bacterium]|jgi:hypothetical protein|nr:hypothetical protein [Caulobacteraceae bacterium]
MAEVVFERELERMFAEAPAFADADYFAFRVEQRMDRGWTARQMLIGGLGVVGGLIGAAQLLGSGLVSRMGALPEETGRLVTARLQDILPADFNTANLPLGGEAIWMSAALALVAIGLAITRAIREI